MPPTSYYIHSLSDTIPASNSTAAFPLQSKDSAENDVVTQHLHQQTLNQSQLNDTSGNILNNQWIAQIEKVSNLTGQPQGILALAKSSGTPYKIISQTPCNTGWSELKKETERSLFLSSNKHAWSHRSVKKEVCQQITTRLHCLLD